LEGLGKNQGTGKYCGLKLTDDMVSLEAEFSRIIFAIFSFSIRFSRALDQRAIASLVHFSGLGTDARNLYSLKSHSQYF
jgi:hypothetical protein